MKKKVFICAFLAVDDMDGAGTGLARPLPRRWKALPRTRRPKRP